MGTVNTVGLFPPEGGAFMDGRGSWGSCLLLGDRQK